MVVVNVTFSGASHFFLPPNVKKRNERERTFLDGVCDAVSDMVRRSHLETPRQWFPCSLIWARKPPGLIILSELDLQPVLSSGWL